METLTPTSRPIPGHLNQLTFQEQVLAIHLNGAFITTRYKFGVKINVCSLEGYFIEIHCRPEDDQWIPYLIQYYANRPDCLDWPEGIA